MWVIHRFRLGFPKKNPFCHVDGREVSISNTFTNFRFSCLEIAQDATKGCGPTNLSDCCVNRRERSSLDALFRLNCSLHLAVFIVLTLNQIGEQVALARTLKLRNRSMLILRNARTEFHFCDHFFVVHVQLHALASPFACPVVWFQALLVRLALGSL